MADPNSHLEFKYCWFLFHKWISFNTFYRTVYPRAEIKSWKCSKCEKLKFRERSLKKDEEPYNRTK